MLREGQTKRLVQTARRSAAKSLLPWSCCLGLLGFLGCFKPDDGREPPLDRIYFPTGLALSPDGDRLYVANSDWDLQFNAGSVQVYDAAQLRSLLPRSCKTDGDCSGENERCDTTPASDATEFGTSGTYWCVDAASGDPCRGLGVQSPGERLIQPGLCGSLDNRASGLLLDSVSISSFATDMIYRPNPLGEGGRLFLPTRSDATLHWIDVSSGTSSGPGRELECGQNNGRQCDANHRRGDGSNERAPDGDNLPVEPYGIGASDDGTAIVVSHQTEGEISLFTNDWERGDAGPDLAFILRELAPRPVSVASIPVPAIAQLDRQAGGPRVLGYQPGFWVTSRATPFVQLVRYFDAVDSPDGYPFLSGAFVDRLSTSATSDVRGMAVDASRRTACETECAGELECLQSCAGITLEVYLANRTPGSILIGNTTSVRRGELSNDRLQVSNLMPIEDGPSRAVMGSILDEQGLPQRRVFVTSFDPSVVTIYDPDAHAITARVHAGRGPTALVVDDAHAIAYVAHFTDSYVGVIDLDARHAAFGTLILALGKPTPPRGDDN